MPTPTSAKRAVSPCMTFATSAPGSSASKRCRATCRWTDGARSGGLAGGDEQLVAGKRVETALALALRQVPQVVGTQRHRGTAEQISHVGQVAREENVVEKV